MHPLGPPRANAPASGASLGLGLHLGPCEVQGVIPPSPFSDPPKFEDVSTSNGHPQTPQKTSHVALLRAPKGVNAEWEAQEPIGLGLFLNHPTRSLVAG